MPGGETRRESQHRESHENHELAPSDHTDALQRVHWNIEQGPHNPVRQQQKCQHNEKQRHENIDDVRRDN